LVVGGQWLNLDPPVQKMSCGYKGP